MMRLKYPWPRAGQGVFTHIALNCPRGRRSVPPPDRGEEASTVIRANIAAKRLRIGDDGF